MTLLLVAKVMFHSQAPRGLDRLCVLAASVIAAGVTTLLDFALIPGMGIAGAAAASSIGYCTAAAFQVAQLLQREPRANVALEAA